MTTALRRIIPLLAILSLLAGCATTMEGPDTPPLPRDMARRPGGQPATAWPGNLDEAEARARIGKLLPAGVKDRAGWSADLHAAFVHLKIPHAAETYCAVVAVTEQESTFQVDPVVPGLPDIVRRELERRADKYGVPMLLVSAALLKTSPNGRDYGQRIDALKTEKQLDALFDDMIGELPFGRQLLADYNPVHTAGPMQVSIDFAERHAREKPYPYPVEKIAARRSVHPPRRPLLRQRHSARLPGALRRGAVPLCRLQRWSLQCPQRGLSGRPRPRRRQDAGTRRRPATL